MSSSIDWYSIEYNGHAYYYHDAEYHERTVGFKGTWVDDSKQKAIENNTVWSLNTKDGFMFSDSLKSLLELVDNNFEILLSNIPDKKVIMRIDKNQHKRFNRSIEEEFGLGIYEDFEEDFISGDFEEARKLDTLYHIVIYPNTPIGFYDGYGTTINNALLAIEAIEEE